MKQKKQLPVSLQVLIMTMITSFVWIIYEIYIAFTNAPKPVLDEKLLSPLGGQIDVNLIQSIKSKNYIENPNEIEVILPTIEPTTEPTLEPTIEPIPESTPVSEEETI